ncbi:MAG TPA: low molecular weight phosphatase family protein [Pontiella sp.]
MSPLNAALIFMPAAISGIHAPVLPFLPFLVYRSGMMKKILFLCSGNYYRSRMAEEYFNHCAARDGMDWQADSMALRSDLEMTGNEGPLSLNALNQLRGHNIPIRNADRMPRTLLPDKLPLFSRIVAMSRREHEPMIRQICPDIFSRLEYWEIGDIGVDLPEEAFEKVRRNVDRLIVQLKREQECIHD